MSTETVTVACKMPHGIVLRLFDMVSAQEAVQGGGYREIQKARARPQTIKINGYLEKYDPKLPPASRTSSFALTSGVPKDFWEEWLKQNHDLTMVTNGLIFAHKSSASSKAESREKEKIRTGLEPIDPDHLPRGVKTYAQDVA